MKQQIIRFGIIGAGLMGREFASAAARWCHLTDVTAAPRIVAVCDTNPNALSWFSEQVPTVQRITPNYEELLNDPGIDAIYCAVPHNLHEQIYCDVIRSGKHLLGEKPFGIDRRANRRIVESAAQHPDVMVRCTSEFPFFPGARKLAEWVRDGRFGRILDVEAGFLHSSDLDPQKPINWKRIVETNGEYGCMGDLGMHVLHLPLLFQWSIEDVRALLTNVVTERPDASGRLVPCETWDNAVLACQARSGDRDFPLMLSMKRIDPGHANTWFIRIKGTEWSAEFSTKYPKQIQYMPYASGREQGWVQADVSHVSAYKTITGGIFEFGFTDSILQMWASYCEELARGEASDWLRCITPEQTVSAHQLFTAALRSQRERSVVPLDRGDGCHG